NTASKRMIEKYIDKFDGQHEGVLRQHSPRPSGEVTDQHRFSIMREEYESATENRSTLDYSITW
ncbi:MAG: N-acetyltransferase, partial [Halobacteriaceae archaeon]